jgi:hypothetical protein
VFGVIIYSSVTINGLRTIVNPVEEDTEVDRIEALRVLSAGNTLIILCLVGVLLLQVCRLGSLLALQTLIFHPRAAKSMRGGFRRDSKPKKRRKQRQRRIRKLSRIVWAIMCPFDW